MKYTIIAILIAISALLNAEVTVHLGPPALGNGGSNPISIPPTQFYEYEVVWLRPNNTEWTFGLFPGIFNGIRFNGSNGKYVSTGAGLVLSAQGVGPGIYAAIGFDQCGKVCFNLEYKKTIGYNLSSGNHFIQPYAIRLGLTFFKH